MNDFKKKFERKFYKFLFKLILLVYKIVYLNDIILYLIYWIKTLNK